MRCGKAGKWGEMISIGRKHLDVSVTGSKETLLGPGFDSNGPWLSSQTPGDIHSGRGVYEIIFGDSLLGQPLRTWWSRLNVCY